MSHWINLLTILRAKGAQLGGLFSQVCVANLLLMSPFLMGSFTELARAGDSLSMPIHYSIAVLVFVIIWASMEFSVSVGVLTMLTYLIMLGWIRRALIPSTGYISNDPITLVSTFVGGLFFLRLVLVRQVPKITSTARLLSILILFMFFEVLNPLQGGFNVGIGGIIFRLTPIFWYFIALKKSDGVVLKWFFILLIFFSMYEVFEGLRQTSGLTEVERFWIAVNRGATQSVKKGVYRSVGTFLSFSEYLIYLNIAASLCWVSIVRRKYVFIVPFLILAVAVILSSSRGGVVNLALMMVVIWAIQAKNYRTWIPRLIIAFVFALWGMTLGIERAKEVEVDDKTAVLLQHQIDGLSDPLGKKSTGGVHIVLITNGILSGFVNPIGKGLGAGTIAAAKFGEGLAGTEADYSDMFMALGFIGGGLYVLICIRFWITIARYWHDTRDPLALSLIAVLTVCQSNWLSGAHYSQSMIVWFAIGSMDRIIWRYRQASLQLPRSPVKELEATGENLPVTE